jgi:hypothetical protein
MEFLAVFYVSVGITILLLQMGLFFTITTLPKRWRAARVLLSFVWPVLIAIDLWDSL